MEGIDGRTALRSRRTRAGRARRPPVRRAAGRAHRTRDGWSFRVYPRPPMSLSLGRNGIRDHGFQILRGPLPTLFLEVLDIRREELCQHAVRGDLERRQLLFRSGVGIHGNQRAGVARVERGPRIPLEHPYMVGFAEVPRQTPEVAVAIPENARQQATAPGTAART